MRGVSKVTIEWFRRIEPEVRVLWATRLFYLSIILGTYCTAYVAKTSFERILMAISWGAITITCLDIIVSTDVRAEQETDTSELKECAHCGKSPNT